MNVTKSKSGLVTVVIHVLIWVMFGLIYFFQPISWDFSVPYQVWIKQCLLLGLLVMVYYFNALVLVPKFVLKNRIGVYLVIIVCIAAIIVELNVYIDQWLNIHQLIEAAIHKAGPPPKHHDNDHNHDWDLVLIAIIASVIGVGTSVTAIQKWQKDKQLHQEMEQDKISSELSFLKAQINPHFFFNTLNNIYALTHIDAETSRKAIHQLSRMMRYVLYDTQNTTTLLSQEIAFVKDYISLMQLRLTNAIKIDFKSPGALKDMAIAPMIFLPFIENAFKHGISSTSPSFIDIDITQQDATVTLSVINTIITEQNNNLEAGSGIGLNNTRRRLDLLYPARHILRIKEDKATNTYSVHLTLDLS
jgi:two-component system LytT family sensor kinase